MTPLADILGGLAARLRTIAGLRVLDYVPDAIAPPTAIVQLPRSIAFDLVAGRGADSVDLRVLVLVGAVSDRASTRNLARYLDGAGATSVKAAIEGEPTLGGLKVDAYVPRVENTGSYSFAGVDYLGALFVVNVTAA